jgi:hypothetical protein
MQRKSRKTKRKQPAKTKRKKFTLKRAAKAVAKTLYRHLIHLPELEREQQIAALERAIAKKFKRPQRKKARKRR